MQKKELENCNRMGYSIRNQEMRRRGSGRSRKRGAAFIHRGIEAGVDMIAKP